MRQLWNSPGHDRLAPGNAVTKDQMTSNRNPSNRGRSRALAQRARRLARRLGFDVTRVGAKAAPVAPPAEQPKRKPATRTIRLNPDLAIVAHGKDRAVVERTKLNDDAWVVGALHNPGKGVEVTKAGSRGWIVAQREESAQAEPELETQVSKLLGRRHIAWLLDHYRVDCVLDVGANTGQYAKALRRNGYQGHIVSFEPVPEYVEAAENAAADDDHWTVQHVALGSVDGTVPIRVQRSFSSMLTTSEYGKRKFETLQEFADTEQVEVPLRRLDGMLDELLAPLIASGVKNPRLYLKMDTQGFDLEVFRGLGDRVKDIVAMQSEIALLLIYDDMPRMPEALATYEAAGFEITGLYPVTREDDGRIIEYDVTMVRAETLPAS
jgi:FkbM family methyltransferase